MKFTPMSQDELDRSSLLDAGTYPFEVIGANEEISKAGNEMIRIKLNVIGQNGQYAHVYDFLMEKVAFKLRHFCEATGLMEKYEAGTLSELDCERKTGFVKIKVDPANGQYQAKNSVADYVKPASPQDPAPIKLKPEEFNTKHNLNPNQKFDDDIPF